MSTILMEFSPTGGTSAVMAQLSKSFVVDSRIDLSRDDDWQGICFGERDVCLIGMPSYGGRAPAIALERLRQFAGGGARAVLVAVYGNRDFEDTLREMADTVRECGFRPVAAVAAVAEHSILPQYGAGRPSGRDIYELRQFGQDIHQDLLDHPEKQKVGVPGNRPYRAYDGVPLKPKAKRKACIECGLCASKCPVNAIPLDNPSQTYSNRCISCMRCVRICPEKARRVNPIMRFVAGLSLARTCKKPKENKLYL